MASLDRDRSGVPKAYLNYVVMNEDQVVVDQGFVPVSEAAKIETGRRKKRQKKLRERETHSVAHETLAVDLDIAEAGYLYTYVSNESNWDVDVHFDQMALSAASSAPVIVQSNDFYPLGLTHSQPLGNPVNKYLWSGKERQTDLGLNWDDFGARFYDPALGRFHTQDRFADKYHPMTPYQYAANNPVNFVDINGDSIWFSLNYDKGGELSGVTMNVTGKVMNLSSRDVDVGEAVSDISDGIRSSFTGTVKVDGKEVSLNTNVQLSEATSLDQVEKSDHLVVLADATGEAGTARGASSQIGGKVTHVDASDFPTKGGLSGFFGLSNTRTTVHEFGHLAGLEHNNGFWNLMKQGATGGYLVIINFKALTITEAL